MLLTKEENRCCFAVFFCFFEELRFGVQIIELKTREQKRTEQQDKGRSAVFFCLFSFLWRIQKTEQQELLFCCSAVLLFCCSAVLLFCCFAVLLFCCSAVLLFCCFAVLLYCCSDKTKEKKLCFSLFFSSSLVVLLPSYFSCLVKQIKLNVLIWFTFSTLLSPTTFCLTTNHFLFKKLTTKEEKNHNFLFQRRKEKLLEKKWCWRKEFKEMVLFKETRKFLFQRRKETPNKNHNKKTTFCFKEEKKHKEEDK